MHIIAFAIAFLINNESRYCTNGLELLEVVWALKLYLYGTEFILQTNHRSLLTALKGNRGNRSYQSPLARWVDRLLPLNFKL